MHIASMYAAPEIIKLLLENGADPVANDNNGKNPLQMIGSKYAGFFSYPNSFRSDVKMCRTDMFHTLLMEAQNNRTLKSYTSDWNTQSGYVTFLHILA